MSGRDQEGEALPILNEVARALNASVDLQTLLARALETVAELLGLRTGWVLLFDKSGEPYLAAEQNLPPGLSQDPKLMTGWCWCLDSFRDGELDGAANIGVMACSRLRKLGLARDQTAGLRYHASVPLQVQNERLGMLNVAGPEWRELDAGELSLLHTIGDLLGVGRARPAARPAARRGPGGGAQPPRPRDPRHNRSGSLGHRLPTRSGRGAPGGTRRSGARPEGRRGGPRPGPQGSGGDATLGARSPGGASRRADAGVGPLGSGIGKEWDL